MGQTMFFKTSFWTDQKMIDELTSQERLFYLYLMTTSQSNMIGCFELSMKTTSSHTGFTSDEVYILLDRLSEHDVIRYSKSTHEVLILNYAKHNWTSSSKFLAAAYKATKNIKDFRFKQYVSHKLIEYGFDEKNFDYEIVKENPNASNFGYGIQNSGYRIQNTEVEVEVEEVVEVYSNDETSKDNNATNSYHMLPDVDVDIDINTNTETEKACSDSENVEEDDRTVKAKPKGKKKLAKNKQYTPEFETFWAAYPRKEGKRGAFASFETARHELGVSLETIIDGVEKYKKTEQWNRDGTKYIPHPVTWLNQRRWEDSPEPAIASNRRKSNRAEEWDELFAMARGEGEGMILND